MTPERRRYAEWTPGFRGAPPATGAAYLVTFCCAVAALCLRFVPDTLNAVLLPFQFGGLATGLSRFHVRRRVLPLRDLPAAAPQYSVRIGLSRDVGYRSDEGHVSFVDGWLVFQGAGCAFSFRTVDVKVSPSETKLEFAGGCRPHGLKFDYAEKGFKEAWAAWRDGTPPGRGEPILPPILPLPRHAGFNHALVAILLGVAAFALPFHSTLGLANIGLIALLIVVLARWGRRSTDAALARLARGKPPRKSARGILGADVHLERLGAAYRADRRRRLRRRALTGRNRP